MAALRDHVKLGAQAFALRLRLGRMVRKRPLPNLLESLTPRAGVGRAVVPLASVRRALRVVESVIARSRVVPNTCLYRALARYAVLRRAGHPARFVMGLAPGAPDVTGHAWIELDGAPLGETIDPKLVVTYAYPN